MNITDAIADAFSEREARRFWAVIKGWLRRCDQCGEMEDWLMKDGGWICHSCGAVHA